MPKKKRASSSGGRDKRELPRRRGRVTSIEVARAAGLSQSVVSRTYTPGASVSAKTRAKVLEMAERLGYKPNAIARSLITRETNIIGVVMAQLANPFYHAVLEALARRLQGLGRRALLYMVPTGDELGKALPDILSYQVDGIIMVASVLPAEMVFECRRYGTPVVLLNRYMTESEVSAVCCDNLAGGREVAEALLAGGHASFAFIAGENNVTSLDRERGFISTLQQHGKSVILREAGGYTYEGGFAAARRLLERADRPSAIFCASDVMALGAMDAARYHLHMRVPEDVSIIGFDDTPAAAWPSHDLTTVQQPITVMVDSAVDLLMNSIAKKNPKPEVRFIPGRLIRRGSARITATAAGMATQL